MLPRGPGRRRACRAARPAQRRASAGPRARAQVLERYAAYGDGVLGRWGARPDGSRAPGVRALAKPLLGLFHGEPGGRRFRCALEDGLRRKPASLSALLQARAARASGGPCETVRGLSWLSLSAAQRRRSARVRRGPCVKPDGRVEHSAAGDVLHMAWTSQRGSARVRYRAHAKLYKRARAGGACCQTPCWTSRRARPRRRALPSARCRRRRRSWRRPPAARRRPPQRMRRRARWQLPSLLRAARGQQRHLRLLQSRRLCGGPHVPLGCCGTPVHQKQPGCSLWPQGRRGAPPQGLRQGGRPLPASPNPPPAKGRAQQLRVRTHASSRPRAAPRRMLQAARRVARLPETLK